jgi:outer membrane protein assembly factor BamB
LPGESRQNTNSPDEELDDPFQRLPGIPAPHANRRTVINGNVKLTTPISVLVTLLISMAAAIAGELAGADWPQFLGPARNGVYEGLYVAENWPSNGPPIVWQKAIGHGFSGPVVVDHKLILFHRLGDKETVECLDARTGNPRWSFAYPTTYQDEYGFDDGPRATPTIAGGRVYTFGAGGMLHCIDFESGKPLWSVDVKADFKAPNGFFGMACSPLVEGDGVLLNIGGERGAGVVAFLRTTGKVLWKASEDEASYASPVAATIGGQRYALFFTRKGFLGIDPLNGGVRFQYDWHSRNRTSVNAATPLVLGDTIFLSASYGTGAILLQLEGQRADKLWSGDDLLSNHYATSVELNGFLYGIHGRADPGFSPRPKLRCVDLKRRAVCWETDSIGAATIVRAGRQLIILSEKGELIEAPAHPQGFQPKCRAQVLESEVRAFPALAQGFFYARSKIQLVCLDLSKRDKASE